jgi:ribosomal protein S18 acetylase RimI-like enzyme
MWEYRTNLRDGRDLSCHEAGSADARTLRDLRIAMAREGVTLSTCDEVRSEDSLLRSFRNDRVLRIIALCGDRCVGEASLRRGARTSTRHVATVYVGVAKLFRSLGVGHALVNAVIDAARAHPRMAGVMKLDLSVLATNTPALRLYESHGFVREGLKRMHILRSTRGAIEHHDVVIMGLILDSGRLAK